MAGKDWKHIPKPLKDASGRDIDPCDACWQAVQKFDDDMLKGLKEDYIDTLLVFAGLFAAVVTAFAVESYQWLQPQPEDATREVLLQISRQLANASFPTAEEPSEGVFTPSSRDVRINIYWFLSIIVSLIAALVGILGKQWIREYHRDSSDSSYNALRRRQLIYTALMQWKVPEILSLLPVLLQTSLILFSVGIVELVWSLHPVLAIVVSVAVGLLFLVVIITTCLPTIDLYKSNDSERTLYPCAYNSPKSQLLQRAVVSLSCLFRTVRYGPFDAARPWLYFESWSLSSPLEGLQSILD